MKRQVQVIIPDDRFPDDQPDDPCLLPWIKFVPQGLEVAEAVDNLCVGDGGGGFAFESFIFPERDRFPSRLFIEFLSWQCRPSCRFFRLPGPAHFCSLFAAPDALTDRTHRATSTANH